MLLWFLCFLKLYFNFGNFLAIYLSHFCCTSLSLFLSWYIDDSLLFIIHKPWILCFYFIYCYFLLLTSLVAQTVKCLPTIQETWVQSLGWEDLLEKEMAIHSSILAWEIPWTEEPGRLPSMGSQRTGHEWVTALWLFLCLTVDNFCQHIFKFTLFFSVIPSLFLSSSQEFFIYGIIFHLALPFGFLCSFYLFTKILHVFMHIVHLSHRICCPINHNYFVLSL